MLKESLEFDGGIYVYLFQLIAWNFVKLFSQENIGGIYISK